MSAFAALNLLNNAAVEQTFTPARIDASGVALWKGSETVFDAKKSASLLVKLPANGGTKTRVSGKVTIPVMDPLDSTKKIDELIGSFEFSLPKSASETARLDLRAYVKDFINDAVVTDAVQNQNSIY
jgi:hypothetical protein